MKKILKKKSEKKTNFVLMYGSIDENCSPPGSKFSECKNKCCSDQKK